MQRKVLIWSVQEAREKLGHWTVETIRNDPKATYEALMDGNLYSFAINVPKLTDLEVANTIGELDVAEVDGIATGVDIVLIQLGEYKYEAVWDIRNVEPERLKKLQEEICPVEIIPIRS